MNKTPIIELYNIQNFERKISVVGVDEISFTVNFYRPDFYGNKVKNEIYDILQGDKYIVLNYGEYDEQYFIIQNPEEDQSNIDTIEKSIVAYSGEYYFANKLVDRFDFPSRQIFTTENVKDDEGFHVGFLNYVQDRTTWTVDHVSAKAKQKVRELKFSNRSMLDCFKSCSEVFDCIFFFDTKNETISCYDVSEIGGNSGIVISDRNFIESIRKNINTDEVKTRLYLTGADDLGIQIKTITGLPYIDNIDYYIHAGYTTDRLNKELDEYNKYLKSIQYTFDKIQADFQALHDKIIDFKSELRGLEGQEREQKELLDGAIMSRGAIPTEPILQKLAKVQNDIDAKKKEIDSKELELQKTYNALRDLQDNAKADKHLSRESIIEYDRLIKDEIQSDSSFVEGMEKDLYEYAQEKLKKLAYPSISFSVDVNDFRKIARFKNPMERLKVGDMVYLESEAMDFNFEVRLIGMTLNYDDFNITLEFGNKYTADDPNLYLSELITNIKSVSTSVRSKDSKWDKGIEAYSRIAHFLDNDLELAKQAIISAKNQVPLLDDRGLWLLKKNEDGTIDNKQVRGINNVIAFTNDNWKTVGTAISGDGINAEAIRGRLGEFVTINANQIFVNEDSEDSPIERVMKQIAESKAKGVEDNLNTKIDDNTTETNQKIADVDAKVEESAQRLEQFAKDYVAKYGGKTYRGENQPTDTEISDGALWLKTNTNGNVIALYRYEGDTKSWREISDFIFKDKDYGGARLGNNGLTTVANGVTINKNGVTVDNSYYGTAVKTTMNGEGFYIRKNNTPIFSVDKNGILSIKSEKGDEIRVTTNGIIMPAASKLTIGVDNRYNTDFINISASEVKFGNKGFYYSTSSGDLTIGGDYGLKWDNRDNTLYIGGYPVSTYRDLNQVWSTLQSLARQVQDGRVPAYVQFG